MLNESEMGSGLVNKSTDKDYNLQPGGSTCGHKICQNLSCIFTYLYHYLEFSLYPRILFANWSSVLPGYLDGYNSLNLEITIA